jgi:hypothetical protein
LFRFSSSGVRPPNCPNPGSRRQCPDIERRILVEPALSNCALRLLGAVRRTTRELGGRTPSTVLIDELLDERSIVDSSFMTENQRESGIAGKPG